VSGPFLLPGHTFNDEMDRVMEYVIEKGIPMPGEWFSVCREKDGEVISLHRNEEEARQAATDMASRDNLAHLVKSVRGFEGAG